MRLRGPDAFGAMTTRWNSVDRLQSAYRVRLNPDKSGRLQWMSSDGDHEVILTTEPDSTPWLRIKSWLLTPFVPVEQL
jgi:cardiolipin synthase C